MSFMALIQPIGSLLIKFTNSLAKMVNGWLIRSKPSGHLIGVATVLGTGGSAFGSPPINRHKPSGVSIDFDRISSLIGSRIDLARLIAVLFPLPASPTNII